MEILLVAATQAEVNGLLSNTEQSCITGEVLHDALQVRADLLITGVGMTATAYHLGRALLMKQYDLVINIGIAGTFHLDWPLGKMVQVVRDCFGDLGAENGPSFLDPFQLQLQAPSEAPFTDGFLIPLRAPFETKVIQPEPVMGVTVNKVHGHQPSIDALVARLQPDVESMEGAAVFYASILSGVPCWQWRSISNHIETRDRSKWNIPLALDSLWSFVLQNTPS